MPVEELLETATESESQAALDRDAEPTLQTDDVLQSDSHAELSRPRALRPARGPVQELEASPWAGRLPPRKRGLAQRALWIGSGAVAAVVGLVVLGAQWSDPASEAPAVATRGSSRVARTAQTAEPSGARGIAPIQIAQTAAPEQQPERAAGAPTPIESGEPTDEQPLSAAGTESDPAPPAAVAPAPPPVAVPTVKIAINAAPWAEIEIDGVPVGGTPLSGVELAVGRHRFVAHMPDGTVRERVTHIRADSTAVLFE